MAAGTLGLARSLLLEALERVHSLLAGLGGPGKGREGKGWWARERATWSPMYPPGRG